MCAEHRTTEPTESIVNLIRDYHGIRRLHVIVCLLSCVGLGMCSACVHADFPTHPITIDLGPGNEELTEQMNREVVALLSKGFSSFAGTGLRSNVDLSERDLRRATIHLSLESLHDINFDGANLTGADLSETTFENCSFRGAVLRKIYSQSDITGSCDLTNADITGSVIGLTAKQLRSTANYKRKDLSHTIFGGDFHDVSFAGFDLRGARFNVKGCNLTDADITGSRLLSLTPSQLRSTKNYKRRDLSDTTLSGDLRGVNFVGFDLRGTVFRGCNLENCDFTDAIITRASFIHNGAIVNGIYPTTIVISKEQLYSTRNYQNKDLDLVLFDRCDLRGFDFSTQCLGEFVRCNLEGANFDDSSFSVALASEITLPFELQVRRKDWKDGAPRYGISESNLTTEQFYSTRTYKSKQLPTKFALEYLDLSGWDFSGVDLRDVSFRGSSLERANLTDARGGLFEYARDVTLAQLKSTQNFKNGKWMFEPGFSLPNKRAQILLRKLLRKP